MIDELNNISGNFIGLFDSGFGGISVLNKCIELMPNENYVFYADSTNCPYGKRTKENLVEIGKDIINKFNNHSPKELIIACGTMSTSNPEELRKPFKNLNIIGTYPDFEHLLLPGTLIENHNLEFNSNDKLTINRNRKKVLILATTATCKSEYVNNKINSFKNIIDIYAEPADLIVKAVESDNINSTYLYDYLSDLLKPYHDADYLVLGCTHFPFAKPVIEDIIGDKVIITSGCEVAANNCYNHMLANHKLNDNSSDVHKNSIIIVDANLDKKRKKTFERLLYADTNKYNITYINNL